MAQVDSENTTNTSLATQVAHELFELEAQFLRVRDLKRAHKGNEALFWDQNNLASSCANCYDVDEQRIERGGKARQDVGSDGWPVEL